MKEKRIQKLRRYILEKKQVTNTEICDDFGVSIETVRRDLKALESEGLIRRVYGGAQLVSFSDAPPSEIEKWDDRMLTNEKIKQDIAAMAVSLIPDGSTVFVDSGTSAFRVLPYMTQKNLTVLTNSLRVAMELGNSESIKLYFIGGVIMPELLVSTGFLATEVLDCFFQIDYAVISCDGFSPQSGTAEYSIEISMLKKNILKKVNHIIALIDHTKFNVAGCCLCCSTEDIEVLITDDKISQENLAALQNKGVRVEIVKDED